MNTVLFFPKIKQQKKIERIRRKYDPLYGKIGPHIALVFPINHISECKLKKIIDSVTKPLSPFLIETGQICCKKGLLYLSISKGSKSIIKIHRLLYKQKIPDNRWKGSNFYSHITLGKFDTEKQARAMAKKLKSTINHEIIRIDSIYIERILRNKSSKIIYQKKIGI